MSKNNTLHVRFTFGTFLCRPLQNYNVKWPNFRFSGERERITASFSFVFFILTPFTVILTLDSSPALIFHVQQVTKTRSYILKWRSRCRRRRRCLRSLIIKVLVHWQMKSICFYFSDSRLHSCVYTLIRRKLRHVHQSKLKVYTVHCITYSFFPRGFSLALFLCVFSLQAKKDNKSR